MKRTPYKELVQWKEQLSHLPLIVRGARQVGKSYLIELFGKQEFEQVLVVNFEKKPKLASCFDSLDPKDIQRELELQTGVRFQPKKTLLFLDEIQDCPNALLALRYFAEEMPEQHVIAAGSLLEFVLEDQNFSFPVGRVQLMNIGPLTFLEYLQAFDQSALVELLQTVQEGTEISNGVHERLLGFMRDFMFVGGMPGVISVFKATGSFLEAQRRQSAILNLYKLDFGKYATKHADYRRLKKLFERSPDFMGKHFKFSKIDPECANPARDYRESLNRLQQARLVLPVHLTKGNGIPLGAEKDEKKFKIFSLDVGLLGSSIGWEPSDNESSIFRGIRAEQFVAQELKAMQDPFIEKEIYFWENTNPNSSAEVDFLVNLNQRMLPIEVKSGSTGQLKSLRLFMEKKKIPLGIRLSERPFSYENGVLSIPFYLISELGRLCNVFQTRL